MSGTTLIATLAAVAGVILTGLGLVFTVSAALLAVMARILVRFTKAEDRLGTVGEKLGQLVTDKDRTHAAMIEQMREDRAMVLQQLREDRAATNERFRYLEERALPATGRHQERLESRP